MINAIRFIYTVIGGLAFTICFLLVYPIFIFAWQKRSWNRFGSTGIKWWGRLFFPTMLIPVDVEWRFKPNKKQTYVFAPNHQSYIDIPLVSYTNKIQHTFLGKSSLKKVPLFGYMYSRLHILVDRKSTRSRFESYKRCLEEVEYGRSVVLFPEGTTSPVAPDMVKFKDGAFKIAVQKQVPIVPVTMPYNYYLLPTYGKILMRWCKLKVIYHEPIDTTGMTDDDIPAIRKQVFETLDAEIKKHHKGKLSLEKNPKNKPKNKAN